MIIKRGKGIVIIPDEDYEKIKDKLKEVEEKLGIGGGENGS